MSLMNQKEIVDLAKKIFSKDRKKLLSLLQAFDEQGRFNELKKQILLLTERPFSICLHLFEETVDAINKKRVRNLDSLWIGDFSFELSLLLNPGIRRGYDWDKKLALKCGGIARLLVIWISEALPCFTYDLYYMKYSKKDNYYEFGPLLKPNSYEKRMVEKASKFFQSSGYFFVAPNLARIKVGGIFSDCRKDGDASIFDALFSDTHSYHDEIVRFVDRDLVDPTGVKIRWNEYYSSDRTLRRREEYRYFPSGNVECIEFDPEGMISKIKIWRDIGEKSHQEFLLDIEAEFKRRENITYLKIRK